MTVKNYTCIGCPQSCDLRLEDSNGQITVSGARCGQGQRYATDEYTSPTRMLTTTVAVEGAKIPRLPVISDRPVPKEKLCECLGVLYALRLQSPVAMGDVVYENILDTGVSILASRDLKAEQ